MKKYLYLIFVGGLLQSCVTYNHSHRLTEIPNPGNLGIKNSYVVDVKIDLKNKVSAASEKHSSPKDAMDEAYYNCITLNNIDIVVDPIFKRTNIWPNKFKYEIQGFAGYYENPEAKVEWENKREKAAAAQELLMEKSKLAKTKVEMKTEEIVFGVRGKNLNTLAKIGPSAQESKSSYMIETVEGCCGDNKNNVVVNGNSSGNGFGNVHLLHTTDNRSSLVDEYKNLIGASNYKDGAAPVIKDYNTEAKAEGKKSISKGFLKKLLGK